MPCPQTLSGMPNDCSASIGGIVEAYIADFGDISKVTVTDGKISAIDSKVAAFKTYSFRKNTGSVTTEAQISEETGSVYELSTITYQFTKMETSKRMEISALAFGETAHIIKDRNGKYWYYGFDNPVVRSASTAQTGQAAADLNGYNISFEDESLELPYEVEASVVLGLLGVEDEE